MNFITDPQTIENTSMDIIEKSVPGLAKLPEGEKQIIKRIIHTTGDVNIAQLIKIHPDAVQAGLTALRNNRPIYTDVQMLRAGINHKALEKLGIKTICKINDPEIALKAKDTGKTRAMVALTTSVPELDNAIIAIGNAPTALFELCRLIKMDKLKPALIVGTPVGFVGAKESKELLMEMPVPYVTVQGTRGGSTIAVAVINALLKIL